MLSKPYTQRSFHLTKWCLHIIIQLFASWRWSMLICTNSLLKMEEKGLSHRQLMDLSSLSWSDCVLLTSQGWLPILHKSIKRAKLIMKAENGDLFIMVPGERGKDPTTCSQIFFQGPEIRLGFKPQVLTRFVPPTMNSFPSGRLWV